MMMRLKDNLDFALPEMDYSPTTTVPERMAGITPDMKRELRELIRFGEVQKKYYPKTPPAARPANKDGFVMAELDDCYSYNNSRDVFRDALPGIVQRRK